MRAHRRTPKPPPGHCAYLTRKLPLELRDRLHAMVGMKRRAGVHYTTEDVVNAALEIGLTLMEEGTRYRERKTTR